MTPDNDKTLRGLFCSHTIGLNEWNDRRDYREKYERLYNLSQRINSPIISALISDARILTLVDDKNNHSSQSEEDYMMSLGKYFSESKIYQKMRYLWSFGMCRDEDGNFTTCDCCGRDLNIFNTSGYGMCDSCELEYKYECTKKDIIRLIS